MLKDEYGKVAREKLEAFKGTYFQFYITGVRFAAHTNAERERRDLFLCITVEPSNPGLLRGLLGLDEKEKFQPHITLLEKPM